MEKRILPLFLALCLVCTGCASLLERSYSSVEPYTDRYWDTTAEDTLKAESYQDLVNSLLMLVEQRSKEGVIRYYALEEDESGYAQAVRAKHEVQKYTVLGSYLLSGMSIMYAENDGYCTLTYSMSYRPNAQDPSTLMSLTDSQSLMDLLRLALREGHDSITAQFISKTSREEVLNVVEQLWQEQYLEELRLSGALESETPPEDTPPTDPSADEGDLPSAEDTEDPQDTETEEPEGEDGASPKDGETPPEPEEEPAPEPRIQFPPCPWVIRFYPDADFPDIVEIVLK